MTAAPLIMVEDLCVHFPERSGTLQAVRDLSFTLGRERLGIVGESGSGKSTVCRALLGLVPPPGEVTARTLTLEGTDLLRLGRRGWEQIRGRTIAMVMQDPKYSLNPVLTIGRQIGETFRIHRRVGKAEARRLALESLEAVQIRDPERVHASYPHQLSGGMGQRAMIAMMLAPDPDILIADEPTSALDATVALDVLSLIERLVTERGKAMILVSHDLDLVSRFCDRAIVMLRGRAVETRRAADLSNAEHPYTRGLLAARPRLDRAVEMLPVLARDPAWEAP